VDGERSVTTRDTLRALRPTRNELVDGGFVIALTTVGLAGFHSAYGGWTFLVVGVVAAVLGALVAHVTSTLRIRPLAVLLIGVIGLLVFGAIVAMRDDTVAGVVPLPIAFPGFVDGLVSGWRRLLTTTTPAGSLGNLLAVSFFCGYVTAWLTVLLARRERFLGVLLVLPAGVLVLSLLFGTREPVSVVVQGALAAVLAIGWLAARRARTRHSFIGSSGGRRLVGAGVMLVVIAVAGFAVGPNLPLASASPRYVLRDQVEPPFDPRDYGSPLNAFQRYLVGDWKDEVLFTIDGLPPVDDGDQYSYVRLAVMDDYDGVVWRVSPGSETQGGRFIRVGEEIPTDVDGVQSTVEVNIDSLRGVWLPGVGVVSGVAWQSPDQRVEEQRDLFRLSTVTSTGVIPIAGGWKPGDSYELDVVVPPPLTTEETAGKGVAAQEVVDVDPPIPEELRTVANLQTKGKASPLEQVNALVGYLRAGYYQSGDEDLGESNEPGHSYARLIRFLKDDQPVGNAEQYAATMALMARTLGIPARVVMGFRVPEGTTEVRGADVHAWVEIGFENGWKQFDPTSERRERPQQASTRPKPVFESQDVPPPPIVPPEPEVNARQGEQAKRTEAREPEEESADAGLNPMVVVVAATVALPVLGAAAFAAVVLALKRRRRRKRRNAPDTAAQVAGGWNEYLDTARDVGRVVPAAATRREKALMIGADGGLGLAIVADSSVFGPAPPSAEQAQAFWSELDRAEAELREPLSWWRRATSSLSTTSLRGPR
jgi:transglutaminase-like putative cysteine protease